MSLPVLGESGAWTTQNGTSFAAPFISGICALLLEAHPAWTPAQLMAALKNTARDLGDPGPDIDYGWGIANALASLDYVQTGVAENLSGGDASEHPSLFSLREPWPNPFNPVVSIPFRLTAPARVTIAIYDITGRKVAMVFDGSATAGEHTAVWNGKGNASGIYLVRASAGGKTDVRKTVMVK